jgi:hypothetical protein
MYVCMYINLIITQTHLKIKQCGAYTYTGVPERMCPTSEKSFLGTLTSNLPTSEVNVYREIKGKGKVRPRTGHEGPEGE